MKIIRPLQLSFNQQVLEQNRTFYFTVSASLGINLQTGKELLDLHYLKDMFECMGENPLPDMGMPKPNGEFLVSGKYFAPGGQPVPGGKATVRLNEQEKTELEELKATAGARGILGSTRRDQMIYQIIDEFVAREPLIRNEDERAAAERWTKQQVADFWASIPDVPA